MTLESCLKLKMLLILGWYIGGGQVTIALKISCVVRI